MDVQKISAILKDLGAPEYRVRQVIDGLLKDCVSSYAQITTLPAPLRAALEREAPILSFSEEKVLSASTGDAHKALLRLRDGLCVETVIMQPKPGGAWSVCLSCQVGCALKCAFCATGRMGFRRSLSPEEICDQVLFWRRYLKAGRAQGTLDHAVFMGMGEPLHCYEQTAAALRLLTDPGVYGFSDRHIAVSTVGLPGTIERFCSEFPQVNLAVSLHAATEELRQTLVPASHAFGLERLTLDLKAVFAKRKRKIFLEWVLLAGVNDTAEQGKALVKFIRSFGKSADYLLHVNLILYNRAGAAFGPSDPETAKTFLAHLRKCSVSATMRKSLGSDVSAACGQLANYRSE
ncbi:MAG: 23S rRNA (adenine(2503)-C(2))-methyltransferase RlmN [Elusimicrobiota bacterium]|jgi:adenine C2-methylase RlmN of 23S rRNA A2503 and tRNA A37